ncbi:MAG TPA: SH3 domain-containing protein [Nitrososphaera sp.]|nr:MAG: hypothetical protein DMF63_13585 [Acidobacteriota bacterium]HEU0047772.1 SH3 domain-containing protein [Nitrososphaera sp.]
MKYLFAGFLALCLSTPIISQKVFVRDDNTNLFGTPSAEGKVVTVLKKNTEAEILKYHETWILIQSPEYVGWLESRLLSTIQAVPQKTMVVETATPTRPETVTTYTPGRTYIRGSRGGCYYINSNGNKTYVARSFCD